MRAITGRDERARTVLATAADTDRAQLPEQVRDLLRHQKHPRPMPCQPPPLCGQRCSDAGYDLAAEIPALRAEVDFLATPWRAAS